MAFDEILAQRIRKALKSKRGIDEKKMFGGVAFLLKGNLLVGTWKDSLVVRLGSAAAQQALHEPYVREFDMTRKPMKNWVLVGHAGIEDDQQLAAWIERAIQFVRTLPPK